MPFNLTTLQRAAAASVVAGTLSACTTSEINTTLDAVQSGIDGYNQATGRTPIYVQPQQQPIICQDPYTGEYKYVYQPSCY